jgi:CRP/FNR family transcriptional regulator, dissimilatory nitrate respiration regulator
MMALVNPLRLRKAQLFSDMSDADIMKLSEISEERSFRNGATIFDEGDNAAGFYVLLEGQVKIFKVGGDGREQILRIVHAGETFAEAAALSKKAFPASAQAIMPIRTAYFSAARFRSLLVSEPELGLRIIATLCQLLHNFVALVEQLALREVSSRVAKHLLDLSARNILQNKRPDILVLDVNKTVLASRLGTVSETLSRTLGKLRSSKVINVKGRTILILDKTALERLSAGIQD